jgi:hypothetical protein
MSSSSSSEGTIQLAIGSFDFNVSIADNPSGLAFRSHLPLNLEMSELNGVEKHCDLSLAIPTNESVLNFIYAGDIVLYGSDTLVLFYQNVSNNYRYTRIGNIDDSRGIADAVGNHQINANFNLIDSSATRNNGTNNVRGGTTIQFLKIDKYPLNPYPLGSKNRI